MHYCSFSIRDGLEHLIFDNFDNQHNSFLWPEYFIDLLCERWIPCQAVTSVLCLHYRPETVHWSTKDAYNSEITFLTLHPCQNWSLKQTPVVCVLYKPHFLLESRFRKMSWLSVYLCLWKRHMRKICVLQWEEIKTIQGQNIIHMWRGWVRGS